MALSDTVKGWGKELGKTIKENRMSAQPMAKKAHAKKKELAKKISKKMVNRDEEGRHVPDADRNRDD